MPISEDLKKIVACPKCRETLDYNEDKDAFTCHDCKLVYKVANGIPNFIIEEAEELKQS